MMTHQLEQAVGSERTGFRTWALVVGCLYAGVTVFVASMAVLRVTVSTPQSVSGYAAQGIVAAMPAPLVGDFWPTGTRRPLPFVNVGS